jgi:hypothetical protein
VGRENFNNGVERNSPAKSGRTNHQLSVINLVVGAERNPAGPHGEGEAEDADPKAKRALRRWPNEERDGAADQHNDGEAQDEADPPIHLCRIDSSHVEPVLSVTHSTPRCLGGI